ncbi:protein ergS [Aspergillus saccharolyticus JOP 1030-1]|uniref:Phosphatidylglycerol lysyltransferase C-terminal domain-containing protein n=1 Tax=Aspergillus saccharolyticus JOP 1030-1 TaxID=1450539 RepID=A0A318ZJD0_9EURO|nr:hypothetical protein BP01DRAFT_337506 [Aspergillus saccharolyticus JOP 1030-1]PYH46937.1 hypothetical protein BP01DRAFT_337506 [Aspergillus saccharolyticus JOP 1030-1]
MTLSSYDGRSIASSRTSHDSSPRVDKPDHNHEDSDETGTTHRIVTLHGRCSMDSIRPLIARYGQVSHMGILDPSYSLFVNTTRTAALCFKVCNRVAIVSGDPMCPPELFASVLSEFRAWRKTQRLGLSFLGTSERMVDYAHQTTTGHEHWTILEFGRERVLDPTTNPVVHEQQQMGKRILMQNRQLLNPTKGGIELDVYVPPLPSSTSPSLSASQSELESNLSAIYTSWCHHRNTSQDTPSPSPSSQSSTQKPQSQAYITTYTPLSHPHRTLLTYLYTLDPTTKKPNGLAVLRYLGAHNGYHLDPCIALPNSPKGISDLLVFAAMALLREMGCRYLTLGFEPFEELGRHGAGAGAVAGLTSPLIERLTRRAYRFAFARLPVQGKRAYFDKFRPDPEKEGGLFLMFVAEDDHHDPDQEYGKGNGKENGGDRHGWDRWNLNHLRRRRAGLLLGTPEIRQVIGVAHFANIRIRRVVWGDFKFVR